MLDQNSRFWLARGKTRSIFADYTTVTNAVLIEACTAGDSAAWLDFMRCFHGIIAITASRGTRRWGDYSAHTIDDLIQETYLKLCDSGARVLREFQFEHEEAIFGFLKIVTANVVNDHFKALRAGKRGGHQIDSPLDGSEQEMVENPGGLTMPERALLAEQVDACLLAAPPETRDRDRAIFWLYYRQGFTAREIASLPAIGLTLKGVESTPYRLVQFVRNQLSAGRAER